MTALRSTTVTDQPAPTTDTDRTDLTRAQASVLRSLRDHPGSLVPELAAAATVGASTAAKSLTLLEKRGLAHRIAGKGLGKRRPPEHWYPVYCTDSSTPSAPDEVTAAADPASDTDRPAPIGLEQDQNPTETEAPISNGTDVPAAGRTGDTSPAATPPVTQAPVPHRTPDPATSTGTAAPSETHTADPSPASPQSPTAVPTPGEDRIATSHLGHDVVPSGSSSPRLAPGALRTMVAEHLDAHPGEAFTATALGRILGRSSGAIANALARLTRDGAAELVTSAPRRYQKSAM